MSSSAWSKLVEGSVELYAETDSVAFSDGHDESAWFSEQERLIEAELAALMPRVQDLVEKARVELEGFEPIPLVESLDDCVSSYDGSVREGACAWELSVAPVGRRSDARDTRVTIALASYPPERARGLFRWQLREVAAGATAEFPAKASWFIPVSIGTATLLGIGSFILIRRTRRKRTQNQSLR